MNQLKIGFESLAFQMMPQLSHSQCYLKYAKNFNSTECTRVERKEDTQRLLSLAELKEKTLFSHYVD